MDDFENAKVRRLRGMCPAPAWDEEGKKNMDNSNVEHIMQFFSYEHLPQHMQKVSAPFCELAKSIVAEGTGLPRNPERIVALRKLLEAKDAAVRAFLAKS